MSASLWTDPGTWIALGISALFLVVGWAMHRVFVKVLQAPPPDSPAHTSDVPAPPTAQATAPAQPPTGSPTP